MGVFILCFDVTLTLEQLELTLLSKTSVCVALFGFLVSYLRKSNSLKFTSNRMPCCVRLSLSGCVFSLLVFASPSISSYVGRNLSIYNV